MNGEKEKKEQEKKQKLLLADDSITIRKVVELVLADEGFELKLTSDGAEALDAVSSFMPDIILADVDMPGLSGYELSGTIKNSPATRSIPVILMVGAFEPVDEELIKKSGADDYIVKPFESHDLISKLKGRLSARQAEFSPVKTARFEEVFPAGNPDVARIDSGGRQDEAPASGYEHLISEQFVEVKEVSVPPVEERTVSMLKSAMEKEKEEEREKEKNSAGKPGGLHEGDTGARKISAEDIKEEALALVARGIQEAVGGLDMNAAAPLIARLLLPEIKTAILEDLNGKAPAGGLVQEIKTALIEAMMPGIKTAISATLIPDIKAAVTDSIMAELKTAVAGPLLSDIKAALSGSVLPELKAAAIETAGSEIRVFISSQFGPELKTAAVAAVTDGIKASGLSGLKADITGEVLPQVGQALVENVTAGIKDMVAGAVEPEVRRAVRDGLPGIIKSVMASTALQVAQSAAGGLQEDIEGIVRQAVADTALPIIQKEIDAIKAAI